jgi:hypothetical protein
MKTLLLSSIVALSLALNAAEPVKPAPPPPVLTLAINDDPYAAGRVGLSYFGMYRAHEFSEINGRFGYGPELSYAFSRNFTLALEGITENPQHSYFDEAGINGRWYFPISRSGFAPYLFVGYTYQFEEDLPGDHPAASNTDEGWKDPKKPHRAGAEAEDNRRHRMNAGAGIELRGKKNGLFGIFTAAAFADGRWTHNFENVGHGLFRVGGRLDFGH